MHMEARFLLIFSFPSLWHVWKEAKDEEPTEAISGYFALTQKLFSEDPKVQSNAALSLLIRQSRLKENGTNVLPNHQRTQYQDHNNPRF